MVLLRYGNKCEYYGCGKWSQVEKNVSFFRFPANDFKRSRQWAINSKREDLLELPLRKRSTRYICARHFPPSAFMNELRNRKTHDAVPLPHRDLLPTHTLTLPSLPLLPALCEMVKNCSVVSCLNRIKKCKPGVSFHRIPKACGERRAWLRALGRPDWVPSKHTYICSEHFEATCYQFADDGRHKAKLKPGALPTLLIHEDWHVRRSTLQALRKTIKVQFKPEMWEEESEEKENPSGDQLLNGEPPAAKRPRGRPRKNPLNTLEHKIDSSSVADKSDFVSCCALACTNTSESHIMNCLPRDQTLRRCWVDKIDRLDWTPDEDSALCEIHFEAGMWNDNEGEEKILKESAIPSLFLHGEAIKSWVTLDNAETEENGLEENNDNNEVIEDSWNESDEEDSDYFLKGDVLEPQIDMVEGAEEVLPHSSESTEEPFETIFCDTTFKEDKDSDNEPFALHIKEEINSEDSSMQDELYENPLEPDSVGMDMQNYDKTSLIQDDEVSCVSKSSNQLRYIGRDANMLSKKSNFMVLSPRHFHHSLKKKIRRRRSDQLTDEFQCPMCYKKLSRRKNLEIHMEKLHKNGELSEYQKMRKREAIHQMGEDGGILRKQLEYKKKPPPALNPILPQYLLPTPLSVEPSVMPIPDLKPIHSVKRPLSNSSSPTVSTTCADITASSMISNTTSSSSSSNQLVTSTVSPFLNSIASVPTLLATTSHAPSGSSPTLLATSSATDMLVTNSIAPTLLATNPDSSALIGANTNVATLVATTPNTPTLIATSSPGDTPCSIDINTPAGRLQNQFLLLLPKHPQLPLQPRLEPPKDDSKYTMDLSKVPKNQRDKLKDKFKEMLTAVLSKNLDPGKIIIAYDRT